MYCRADTEDGDDFRGVVRADAVLHEQFIEEVVDGIAVFGYQDGDTAYFQRNRTEVEGLYGSASGKPRRMRWLQLR